MSECSGHPTYDVNGAKKGWRIKKPIDSNVTIQGARQQGELRTNGTHAIELTPCGSISRNQGVAVVKSQVHRYLLLAILSIAWISAPSSARGQTSLTWENIFLKSTGAREAALSPDGKWVAVTATTEQERGIYLISTGGGEPKFWVEGRSPSWSSDSKRIVFLDVNDIWTFYTRVNG